MKLVTPLSVLIYTQEMCVEQSRQYCSGTCTPLVW